MCNQISDQIHREGFRFLIRHESEIRRDTATHRFGVLCVQTALIGNPVRHSLSPVMQNAALQYLGLDLIYIAIDGVPPYAKIVQQRFRRYKSSKR